MKKYILLLIPLFSLLELQAQRSGHYEYGQELIWGVNKNTAGGLIGGFVARGSRKIGENRFESIGLELMNIKHPKEFRRNSALTASPFIFGKLNHFLAIRTQYGREFIIFDKTPIQGAEVKLNFAAGPSFGLLKPYYIDILVNQSTFSEPYDPEQHVFEDISGQASYFLGFSESELRVGLNTKASVSFELGTMKSQVTGFEIGFLLDAYAGPVEILVNTDNRSVFPTAFITVFYGSRK